MVISEWKSFGTHRFVLKNEVCLEGHDGDDSLVVTDGGQHPRAHGRPPVEQPGLATPDSGLAKQPLLVKRHVGDAGRAKEGGPAVVSVAAGDI